MRAATGIVLNYPEACHLLPADQLGIIAFAQSLSGASVEFSSSVGGHAAAAYIAVRDLTVRIDRRGKRLRCAAACGGILGTGNSVDDVLHKARDYLMPTFGAA